MMLMCGQSNQMWHWAAGRYPGRIGMLLGPSYFNKQAIRFWMPYALDNDAFTAYSKGTKWSESAWLDMLKTAKTKRYHPRWILVPDVVGNRCATINNWTKYAPIAREFGWPLAFAVQDGMLPDNVPSDASIIFIGGSTSFKWRTLPMWAASFKRVHVGRVNSLKKIWVCEDYGVESCDGTGWFRDTSEGKRAQHIIQWLNWIRNETPSMI
jgi:hypothetical protein